MRIFFAINFSVHFWTGFQCYVRDVTSDTKVSTAYIYVTCDGEISSSLLQKLEPCGAFFGTILNNPSAAQA
jgi:hypothetical protein